LYLLAVGTKSVTATLPAALLVMLWWQKGRLSWRRDVAPLAPWLALGMGAGLVTVSVERNLLGAAGPEYDLRIWERALLAGRVIWFYLGKLAWPVNLAFIYPHWNVTASAAHWIGCLVGVLAVTTGFWWVRDRSRGPLAGWLFFIGSLFPALGFINVYPFRYSYVADHFQYLPSLGMIALAAAGAAAVLKRAGPGVREMGLMLCTVLAAALAVLAHRQARDYRDAMTLYRATIARNPGSWMAHNNLAILLAKSPGGEAEAIAHYRAAVKIEPDSPEIHYNLADALAKLPGEQPEAIEQYEQALRLRPDYAQAHNNLAMQLARLPGRLPDALAHYEAALRLDPANAQAHNNLAVDLANLPGRQAEAIAHFQAALRIDPNFTDAHANLANLLTSIPGRELEAVAHYEAALRLDPRNAQTHNNLAVELANLPGRMPDAIAHFEAALRINPDFPDAQLNLANVLAGIPGRAPEALVHYRAAVRLAPEDAEARRGLQLLLERESSGTR
jgi:tetratricopeptide (TPR) repeat protein